MSFLCDQNRRDGGQLGWLDLIYCLSTGAKSFRQLPAGGAISKPGIIYGPVTYVPN